MGQRIIDESGDAREEAQEDNDDDGAVERTESRLFGAVGRNDRGAYDITAFALAVSDFSHDRLASMVWATLCQRGEDPKIKPNDPIWNEQS